MVVVSGSLGIVVGVDGSPEALLAVDWAACEAVARRCPLTVCHVVRFRRVEVRLPDELLHQVIDSGQAIVDGAVERARVADRAGPVVGRLECGGVAEALLGLADSATELVLGARGGGGFDRLRLGSVVGQVVAHAGCPVTVVRAPAGSTGVVVGVDGSDNSRAALEYGFRFAVEHQLPVQAMYVHPWAAVPLPGFGYQLVDPQTTQDAGQRLVDDTVAPLAAKFPEVPVESTVVSGHPAGVLADTSRGATLLVVGSRGHGGFTGLVLGSVSQAVLRHAHCPVTIVH